jgi:hypothetical protein
MTSDSDTPTAGDDTPSVPPVRNRPDSEAGATTQLLVAPGARTELGREESSDEFWADV